MRVRIVREAEAEMESARQYLNRQSPQLGRRFLDDFEAVVWKIADDPAGFPLLETLPGDHPYRRALLRTFRYVVIFEILAEEILIVAVAHFSRKSGYWLDRKR